MSGTVGRLTVPFMVDATREPIDFKELDADHVDQCAERTRCGICGRRIRSGPIAFIGPDDGRTCFADPWMHPACAELAMAQCPFLTGRRDWRDSAARADPLTQPYSRGMRMVLAFNWRSHRDSIGAWHFEALGPISERPA
jgi:hypothetical protein